MAILKESTQEKKLRRNREILRQYNELKSGMTTRDAQVYLADAFNIAKDTIIKILYDPNYSNSPLIKNDEQSIASNCTAIAMGENQTPCQLT